MRDDRGEVTRLRIDRPATSTGLVNGEDYRFQVRATQRGGLVGLERLLRAGHAGRQARASSARSSWSTAATARVTLRWTPADHPDLGHRALLRHLAGRPGGGQATREPRITIARPRQQHAQAFTVVAENALDYGTPRTSDTVPVDRDAADAERADGHRPADRRRRRPR